MPLGPQHYGGAVFEKFNAVLAVGPIEKGDAEKFEKVIPLAGRDMFGNIALVINSPGGSVEEAFKIVEIMDREEVSVYVPGTCASACASIIYLSGRFHIVLDKGSIGFHPCFAQKGAALDPSSLCNERIAENAANHGTDYGSVQGLMEPEIVKEFAHDNSGVLWVGANCLFGLCGPPGREQGLAIPSFKCEAAKLPSEKAICSNRQLARYDNLISKHYFEIMDRLQNGREPLRKAQVTFLTARNRCAGDARCMRDLMKKRYDELMNLDVTLPKDQAPTSQHQAP